MDRRKRKKVYYIPGIISLIVLPFIFIHFANKELKATAPIILPIYLADINLPKKFPKVFKRFGRHFPPSRNYVDIYFTGDNEHDKTKLAFAQLRIKEILSRNDSIRGVHFKFGNNSQYWTFVKAINILRYEGAKSYMPLDNDLWFYNFPPDTSTKTLDYKCLLCGDIVICELNISIWTKTTVQAKNILKSSWGIILGFLVFLISIFILPRKNSGR